MFIDKWENGQIRTVASSESPPYKGAFYTFRPNGKPIEYSLFDINGVFAGERIIFHPNGKIRFYEKYNIPHQEMIEYNEFGKKIRHLRLLNSRRHGYQYYNVNGKEVTEYYYKGVIGLLPELVENPNLITKELVIAERNTEVRRAYLDLIGTENFLNFFDYEVLDIDIYRNDILYRINLGEDKMHMVKFLCPSTGDIYFHFAPNDLMTLGKVKCWMFGIDGDIFEPIAEA